MATGYEVGVWFHREQEPSTLIDYARRVEAMGFDHLWVIEDHFYLGGVSQAAIALAATDRLTVGIGINPALGRNAAFLAMEYGTLARAFPGRFIGGIGHGTAERMEEVGAKPASWLRSIEEVTTAVRRLLRGDTVDMQGEYVRLSHAQLKPAPDEVPPVLLGVRGDKSLRLAGRCADGVLLVENSAPSYVRKARSLMAAGRADAGVTGDGQVIVYANCVVDDDDPELARSEMRNIVAELNGPEFYPTIAPLDFADEMRALIAAGGVDALRTGMPDAWLRELAITGSHQEARESVANLVEAGAGAIVLVPPENADWDAWLEKQAWAVAER